jgi:hypothetical protein
MQRDVIKETDGHSRHNPFAGAMSMDARCNGESYGWIEIVD